VYGAPPCVALGFVLLENRKEQPMTTLNPTYARSQSSDRSFVGAARAAGLLLIAQFVLMFAAFFILGSAINWPASLDEPASVNLPLIVEQAGAVALGYTSYFVSALLLAPIALLLYSLLRDEHPRPTLLLAAGFGVIASFAKLLGIGRWLLMMPFLAQSYVDPAASPATRDAIVVTYDAFNNYAGGVGEVLGVALFSGLWTLLVSVSLLRGMRLAPRWMGYFGLVAAALLLVAVAGGYGLDLGPLLIVQGFAWQFWLLFLGIFLLRRAR
jgi:hypothetical protein